MRNQKTISISMIYFLLNAADNYEDPQRKTNSKIGVIKLTILEGVEFFSFLINQ
jgi:hypothetical protein